MMSPHSNGGHGQTHSTTVAVTIVIMPRNAESVDDLPTFNLTKNFFDASAMLQQPFEEVLADLKSRPSCVISDKHLSWTTDVLRKSDCMARPFTLIRLSILSHSRPEFNSKANHIYESLLHQNTYTETVTSNWTLKIGHVLYRRVDYQKKRHSLVNYFQVINSL
ncbi:hypothetical protein L6452_24610 [Arctium lappa]|uniref:Uncharacterized protein n=1 Tax=Arctium lappa TaxID=4217 RepID=A0ACB9AA18_ARCLA|nr:hypothetical protein L6452_24610 [Arctium lappa]